MLHPLSLLGLLLPLADAPPSGPPAFEPAAHGRHVDELDRERPDGHGHFVDSRDRAEVERLAHAPVFAAPLADGALYLRIPSFHAGTAQAVHAALEPHVRRASVRYLVLDLRDNRGGSVSAAIEVADEFVDEGVLAGTRGQAEIANMLFLAKPAGLVPEARVAVLVDGMTASSAELLAGILGHRRGALLVGRDTYGKSSVQSQVRLDGAHDTMLTIARYYFDDGSSIGRSGLHPDIAVPVARLRKQRPPQVPAELPALLRADSLILEALDALRRRDAVGAVQTSPKA